MDIGEQVKGDMQEADSIQQLNDMSFKLYAVYEPSPTC